MRNHDDRDGTLHPTAVEAEEADVDRDWDAADDGGGADEDGDDDADVASATEARAARVLPGESTRLLCLMSGLACAAAPTGDDEGDDVMGERCALGSLSCSRTSLRRNSETAGE